MPTHMQKVSCEWVLNVKVEDEDDYTYEQVSIYAWKYGRIPTEECQWNIGGFTADAGVTGRKLAVDNYGPRVPLGGGAFSGKDCTKVDRSGAYMARRVAVDILEQNDSSQEVYVQLAVLNEEGEICYHTPITQDVIGYLTEEKVEEYLTEIKEL